MTMEIYEAECPLCARVLVLAPGESGSLEARRFPVHSDRPDRLPRLDVMPCGASGLTPEDARAVREMTREGGDRLRLAAHP